jgi:hypothetical protein
MGFTFVFYTLDPPVVQKAITYPPLRRSAPIVIGYRFARIGFGGVFTITTIVPLIGRIH